MITLQKIILITFFSFALSVLQGQEKPQESKPIKTVQPKIIVVPYTTSGVSMADELANNDNARLAISIVKEGFDSRNFPTVDLSSRLKQLSNDRVMEMDDRTSIKQEVIELSGADIQVEVETNINRSSGGNSITVILSAYDAFTSVSLANKSAVSPKFYTDSYERLIKKATDEMIDEFLNVLQTRFEDIRENGRMLAMNINFSENSNYDMDFEFEDGDLLSDKIEFWLEENALNSYFHLQGVTSTKMIVDEIRVPLKTGSGKNYRYSNFVRDFRKYFKTLGIDIERDLQGGRIFITIL